MSNIELPKGINSLDEMDQPELWYPKRKKCTCGSDVTYGEKNELHTTYCDLYEEKCNSDT